MIEHCAQDQFLVAPPANMSLISKSTGAHCLLDGGQDAKKDRSRLNDFIV